MSDSRYLKYARSNGDSKTSPPSNSMEGLAAMDQSYYSSEMESWLPFSLDTFGNDSDGSNGSAGKGESSFANFGQEMFGGLGKDGFRNSLITETPAEKLDEVPIGSPMTMGSPSPWGNSPINSKMNVSESSLLSTQEITDKKTKDAAQNIVTVNDLSPQNWSIEENSVHVNSVVSGRSAIVQDPSLSQRIDGYEDTPSKNSSMSSSLHHFLEPPRNNQRMFNSNGLHLFDQKQPTNRGGGDHVVDEGKNSDRNQRTKATPPPALQRWKMPQRHEENVSADKGSAYPMTKIGPPANGGGGFKHALATGDGTHLAGGASSLIPQTSLGLSSWTGKFQTMTSITGAPSSSGGGGGIARDTLALSPCGQHNMTDNDNSDMGEDFDDDIRDQCSSGRREKSGSKIPNQRRLERNAREQKRSKKIANQIEMLRQLLRNAGKPVKGNKASILSETADFIQELREVRKYLQETALSGKSAADMTSTHSLQLVTDESYRLAFQKSGVPMAIATMDGCLVDGNDEFLGATSYTREELLKLTIFNLTAASDLQETFGRVSQMLRSTEDSPLFRIRAVMKHNEERGYLAISLVRDDQRRPIYFFICSLPTDDVKPHLPSLGLGWRHNSLAQVPSAAGNNATQVCTAGSNQQQKMPPRAVLSSSPQVNPQGLQSMPSMNPVMPIGLAPGTLGTHRIPGMAGPLAPPGIAPGMMGFGCVWVPFKAQGGIMSHNPSLQQHPPRT